MTMSLVGPYLTTTNYKKPKQKKLTQAKLEALQIEWRKYNKRMRQTNMHSLQYDTFEDYLAYIRGTPKPRSQPKEFKTYKPETSYARETPNIPSYTSKASFAPCTKREQLQYTGERRLVGIATMHKSNMVPVFADDDDKTGSKQATEIAKMRRG